MVHGRVFPSVHLNHKKVYVMLKYVALKPRLANPGSCRFFTFLLPTIKFWFVPIWYWTLGFTFHKSLRSSQLIRVNIFLVYLILSCFWTAYDVTYYYQDFFPHLKLKCFNTWPWKMCSRDVINECCWTDVHSNLFLKQTNKRCVTSSDNLLFWLSVFQIENKVN